MPTPSLPQLKALIDEVLNAISTDTGAYLNRNTADAAYAAYVFGLALRAAERVADPNSVRLDSAKKSPPPKTFVIRGSPGALHSTDQDYGYAVFKYDGRNYEIHLGVQYRGSSDVLHEFDISIIPAQDADESRKKKRPPGPSKPCAVFECKFYAHRLGIEIGRAIVGLKSDFTGVPISRLVSNSESDSVALFLKKTNRPKLSKHIEPGNPDMETEFVYALADEFRNSL